MTHLKKAIPVSAVVGRAIKASLQATCLAFLAGCQVIGPGAVQHGRVDYNEVIAKTNKEQTFLNILRVRKGEPTAFMDVSEIDAVVLSSASFSAGIGGVGAGRLNTVGETGSVAGTLQYQESPTIRYQPLLGQALIAQLSTPVSVDALANLASSGWGPGAVLDLALDRLTPNPDDRPQALRAIEKLWNRDALIIGAAKNQKSEIDAKVKSQTGIGNVSVQVTNSSSGASAGAGSPNDSLVLYYNEKVSHAAYLTHFWNQLRNIYKDTQDKETPSNEIVLRTKPGNAPGLSPIIQTRSALGILKTGFEYDRITIVDPSTYASRTDQTAQLDDCYSLPTDTSSKKRHYLLIIQSRMPPPSRNYVMHFDPQLDPQRGEYFYIADDDDKSKKTFTLLNLFLIVEATTAPPPLTPTISVGPSGG